MGSECGKVLVEVKERCGERCEACGEVWERVERWEVSVGKCGKTCQVSMGVREKGVG